MNNTILLWTQGCWTGSGVGGCCMLYSPHHLQVESSLCNGRELSCLIGILAASEPSLLPAFKPTGAAYEKIFSHLPIYWLLGRICISIWLPSKSFCCLKNCSLGTECLVLCCCLSSPVLRSVSAVSFVESPFLPCLFLSLSCLSPACSLWFQGILSSIDEWAVISFPSFFWNTNLIDMARLSDAWPGTSDYLLNFVFVLETVV